MNELRNCSSVWHQVLQQVPLPLCNFPHPILRLMPSFLGRKTLPEMSVGDFSCFLWSHPAQFVGNRLKEAPGLDWCAIWWIRDLWWARVENWYFSCHSPVLLPWNSHSSLKIPPMLQEDSCHYAWTFELYGSYIDALIVSASHCWKEHVIQSATVDKRSAVGAKSFWILFSGKSAGKWQRHTKAKHFSRDIVPQHVVLLWIVTLLNGCFQNRCKYLICVVASCSTLPHHSCGTVSLQSSVFSLSDFKFASNSVLEIWA